MDLTFDPSWTEPKFENRAPATQLNPLSQQNVYVTYGTRDLN